MRTVDRWNEKARFQGNRAFFVMTDPPEVGTRHTVRKVSALPYLQ